MRLSLLMLLVVCLAPMASGRAFAQLPPSSFDVYREPVSFADELTRLPPPATPRLPIFGMTSFLQNPLDIDDPDIGDSDGDTGTLVSFGRYRPNFDFNPNSERRPIGYQKAHVQMQVAEVGPTSVFVTVQTLSPGDGGDGVSRGPTIVNPSLGWFHDLGRGAAVQGFLGQDLYAHSHWSDGFGIRVRGGVGIQCPVPGLCSESGDCNWFFMVQARAYYRYDDVTEGMSCRIAPGVHWRTNEACWLSVTAIRYQILSFLYRY